MLTFGPLPLLGLALVLVSAFLLVGALLPPRLLGARLPGARSARIREVLVLAAIGILVPVAVGSLVVGLS